MKHSHFGFWYLPLREPNPLPIHGAFFAQVPPVPAGSPTIHIGSHFAARYGARSS